MIWEKTIKNKKFNSYLKNEVSFLHRKLENVEGIMGKKIVLKESLSPIAW